MRGGSAESAKLPESCVTDSRAGHTVLGRAPTICTNHVADGWDGLQSETMFALPRTPTIPDPTKVGELIPHCS